MAKFNWFPGHMASALRTIKQTIGLCDLVLEVRDARVRSQHKVRPASPPIHLGLHKHRVLCQLPKSSGVYKLQELIGNKPTIVILNKADLAAPGATQVCKGCSKLSALLL